ncbi:DUF1307 domain-containing protein [Streptococcus parasanguinis]|uniref:DUF1307 domain-containing protein n=1 Tax=Streptococcus parasanguinis (strain ATCC 15912 / DSM 6778 / CIP 104372 / LMG 14537) TaxID=760570 RepID=F8DJL3_STREP|nr:DUF1307 domain-containing protein [Streptococcus parasanguinis]AEH56080.1 hypothetical protein HMPREF0833_11049 [Streptococcus parasanguinis ATCC 15912]SUN87732.1 Uncharacterized protein conserved in bacteria [Streptococcus parasanguinis]
MRKITVLMKFLLPSLIIIFLTACQSIRQEKYKGSYGNGDESIILTIKNKEILKTEFWKELPDIDASDSLEFNSAKDSLLENYGHIKGMDYSVEKSKSGHLQIHIVTDFSKLDLKTWNKAFKSNNKLKDLTDYIKTKKMLEENGMVKVQ